MDNYENLSLEQLDRLDLNYFRRHRSNGGASEFDLSINDISRARIEAFRREKGACFLGRINLWDRERDNPDYRFTPYTGQLVHNSEFTLVLPTEDETLRALIVGHNRTRKTLDSHDASQRIRQITDRVQEFGGILLTWA